MKVITLDFVNSQRVFKMDNVNPITLRLNQVIKLKFRSYVHLAAVDKYNQYCNT